MTTRYTRLEPQIQCNNCRQIQVATNKYCCNCGSKFIAGLGDELPADDVRPFKQQDYRYHNDWYIPPVTCVHGVVGSTNEA